MCPHTTCVHILIEMCPRTTTCVHTLLYMCPRTTMCHHTTMYVSAYYYMCPHTTKHVLILVVDKAADHIFKCSKYVFSRYCGCLALLLLILLYMCPHNTIFVPHATTYVFLYSYLPCCCGRLALLSRSAYASIRQHTSAYASMRQHTYVMFAYTGTCRVVAAILPRSQCRWQRR
jgi:hypothetical protein